MLKCGFDTLLAVRHLRRPCLVLGQPHALVEHDLEVEPVIAELGHENGLHKVGQAVLFEQGGGHLAAGVGPALPAHDVVNPVVEDGDRVLQGRRRAPDPGGPGLLACPNLVVEGDDLLFVQVFGFHWWPPTIGISPKRPWV